MDRRDAVKKRLQSKLAQRKTAVDEHKNQLNQLKENLDLIKKELGQSNEQADFVEFDLDSDTDSSSESDIESDDEDGWDYVDDGLTKEERLQMRKYELMREYNVGALTEWFVRKTWGMDRKHNNLKRFSKLSGIKDNKKKLKVMGKIMNEMYQDEMERRGMTEESGIVRRLEETDVLEMMKCCCHAVHILRILGCVEFLKVLPGKQLSTEMTNITELENYIKLYEKEIRMILVKSQNEEIDVIKWCGEITNKAFGIKLKKKKVLHMKSRWKWDKENNRILPINPDGGDEIIPPHPSGDSRILLKQYRPNER